MPKVKARAAFVLVAVMAGLATGCSTQARRVDCDGRLWPINAPESTSRPAAAPSKGQTP